MKKILVLTLLVITVFVISGCDKNEEVVVEDNWQTYNNEEVGFIFEYPNSGVIDEISDIETYIRGVSNNDNSYYNDIKIYIQPYDRAPEEPGLLQSKEQLKSFKEKTGDQIVSGFNYSISGASFYYQIYFFVNNDYVKITQGLPIEGSPSEVFSSINGKEQVLEGFEKKENVEIGDEANEIIEKMERIKESIEINHDLVYKNEEVGFSFEYPKDYNITTEEIVSQGHEAKLINIKDSEGNDFGEFLCPILETGYESWTRWEEMDREFVKNGKNFDLRLRFGYYEGDQDIPSVALLTIDKGRGDDDFDFHKDTCQFFSSDIDEKKDIIIDIYNSIN